MRKSLESAIGDFAKARFPRRAPDRRALEAELFEIAEPVLVAFDALDVYAGRASDDEGNEGTAFVRWRSWCGAVQEVFDRSDRCWIALGPVLGEAPIRRPLWRRVLRLR